MKTKTFQQNIPQELKKLKVWGLWSLEKQNDRLTKVPYNAITNKHAKTNDSSTWTDFETALQGLKKYKRDGLAVFLGKGLCGLDIDHIDDELTKYEDNPKSNNLIKHIQELTNKSYMEVSQSGAGIHVLFRGIIPDNAKSKKEPYELYSKGRFFALTGNLINQPKYEPLDGQQVQKLVKSTVGFKEKQSIGNIANSNDLSIDEIENKILASNSSSKFKKLMSGNISEYDNDNSSADIALCNILAFWTNRDPEKMDEIFRTSKLFRPEKWDKRHSSNGLTYGQMTIQKAIVGTRNGYDQQSKPKYNLTLLDDKAPALVNNPIPINSNVAPILDQQAPLYDWTAYFIYKRNSEGETTSLKSTVVKNAFLIAKHDPHLKGIFKYNEFTQNVEITEDRTINLKQGIGKIKIYKGDLQDIDIVNLGLFTESNPDYKVSFKNQLLYDAVEAVARQNSYNPIVDYMNACEQNWDGKHRLDNFFPTFLGAEKSDTTNLITRLWFMGGVAKAYHPYAKFDYCLDLVGGQGTGKTTLLQKIAPLGMYTDQFTSFTDKDDLTNMKDAFIVNDDEMDASNKSSFAEIKKFITIQTFKFRRPYGRIPGEFPKHFLLARTTNEKAHLRDRSGDRRFITILVNPKKQKKHPFEYLTEDYVKQLWGEAVHLYKDSEEPFALSDSDEKLLKANREQFAQTTALEDLLTETIENSFTNNPFIVPSDLAFKMFDDENYFASHRNESSQINYYMEHLGFEKKKKKINGKTKMVFLRVE